MSKLGKEQLRAIRTQMKSMVLMFGYKTTDVERTEMVRLLTNLIRSETTSD